MKNNLVDIFNAEDNSNSSDTPSTANEKISLINYENFSLLPGQAIYSFNNNGMKLAQANNDAKCFVFGLLGSSVEPGKKGEVLTDGILSLTLAEWANIVEEGSLVPNKPYYLSPYNLGKITVVAPENDGLMVTHIGTSISNSAIELEIEKPMFL